MFDYDKTISWSELRRLEVPDWKTMNITFVYPVKDKLVLELLKCNIPSYIFGEKYGFPIFNRNLFRTMNIEVKTAEKTDAGIIVDGEEYPYFDTVFVPETINGKYSLDLSV